MSAWGAGSFDNDWALAWTGELLKSENASLVRATLNRALRHEGTKPEHWQPEKLSADLAAQALAAAEIVAAWNGQPLINMPYDVARWLEWNRPFFEPELVALAGQAVAKVKTESRLKELWGEANASQWLDAVTDLEQRLSV